MSSPKHQKRPEGQSTPTGLDRFIDNVTETWFNDNFRDWPWSRRFAFAFAGSATFALAFFAFDFPETSSDRQADPQLLDPELFYALVLVPVAIWFACLVCHRNKKSGPTRLYLSGFLLPTFVWATINTVFVGTP